LIYSTGSVSNYPGIDSAGLRYSTGSVWNYPGIDLAC
jgi:hypothetical protein